MTELISKHGGYRNLKSYQMAEIVFDLTFDQDFLRVDGLPQWPKDDPRALAVRKLAYEPNRTYKTYMTYLTNPGNRGQLHPLRYQPS